MLVKKLFIINFRYVHLTNVIKANYLTISFQGFRLPFKNSFFKEKLLCVYRAGPYP